MNKKLVYVDTDVGLGTPGAEIDDGAALIFLLRNKLIDIVGAGSVFGNISLHDAALNLDRLLTWLGGEHIPLGFGAERPLIADTTWFESWQSVYGKTLSWNSRPVTYLAANLIIHTIRTHPGQVSIISLGPMTNLALAIRLEPAIIPLTREVIVMGGSFNVQNPAPEFNVRCDPEAAQIVFSSGWKVHILGLDITRRVHFSRGDFASLRDGNPAVELLKSQKAPMDWVSTMNPIITTGGPLGLAAKAAHPNAGKLLIDFILSKSGQTQLRNYYRIPSRADLEPLSAKLDPRRLHLLPMAPISRPPLPMC